MVGGKFQRRVLKAFAEANFENITSDAEADSFIAAAIPLLEQLNAMERKAVQLGRYLPDDMQEAREVLTEALKPNSTFAGLCCTRRGWITATRSRIVSTKHLVALPRRWRLPKPQNPQALEVGRNLVVQTRPVSTTSRG